MGFFGKKDNLNKIEFKELLDRETERRKIIAKLEKQKFRKKVKDEWKAKQKDKLAGVKNIFRL